MYNNKIVYYRKLNLLLFHTVIYFFHRDHEKLTKNWIKSETLCFFETYDKNILIYELNKNIKNKIKSFRLGTNF